MVLAIQGQDIRELSVGLLRDGVLAESRTAVASPETYLATIDATLSEWGVALADLGAVAVVTGPGSFTSSRVSVMIANAIAFARGIPVIGIPNADRVGLADLAFPNDFPSADRYAVPVYDRPPHITVPTDLQT